jgi:hypothetical protein
MQVLLKLEKRDQLYIIDGFIQIFGYAAIGFLLWMLIEMVKEFVNNRK